ncbi:MATE family efflux transporter [[Clostridium] aminophilum]|uniref:Multidrug export protein MepA n=1 Tax=[Clostridium] aminophilum TaxID=1526 RepID=A0A1I6J9K5_9FIRM|nr:MATE family efflux transporter [[Clostridium] aminophilum]SFR75631.1 putative efflux protein, MATE family [[Clostridium] aminophilum]
MAMTQEQRFNQMMNERIETLIPKLALPSIVSMLITAIYNMADTFFVSQISTSASGAVGIIFSMTAAIQAMAFTIGMGSGNMISRLLGQKKKEDAARYAAVGFFTELIVGAVIAALGLTHNHALVRLLGATETIAPYAESYARFILYGTPFFMCSLGMNNMLRFQGNSFYSMIGIGTGGVLNMILDPILIFGFGMGIAGAAIATAFSQFVSFSILLAQCNRMPACISIRARNFRPTPKMYGNIFFIGFPSLARQGIMSVSTIILNHTAAPFGDAAIAAMAIVTRISVFMNSAVIGFGQGFQPVCGFNYGAKQYKRVERAYYFSLKVTFCFLLAMAAIVFVFAEPVVTVFRREDAEVIRIGTLALRLQCLTMPLAAQITMANMFSQTVGYGIRATLVASLKFGICLIPALAILPPLFGILGIQMAQPAADIAAAVIAFLITRGILNDLKKMAEQ